MNKLNILWTSSDLTTFQHMIAMYARNSRAQGWWDQVNLIIWGASTEVVKDNVGVQAELQDLIQHGVSIEACKAYTDSLGVTELFMNLGVDVKFMGSVMTGYLKANEKLLTF